jgi:hypothetical protein
MECRRGEGLVNSRLQILYPKLHRVSQLLPESPVLREAFAGRRLSYAVLARTSATLSVTLFG